MLVGRISHRATTFAFALLMFGGCLQQSPEPAPPATIVYGCKLCEGLIDQSPSRNHFENWIAVSPVDEDHFVIGANYQSSDAPGTDAFVSRDGGESWRNIPLPYGERVPPTHPLYQVNFVADPTVTFSAEGNVVALAAVGLTAAGNTLPVNNFLFVARSFDGGDTFAADDVTVLQQSVQVFPAIRNFSDRPVMTRGPNGLLLLAWGSADIPGQDSVPRFLDTQTPTDAAALRIMFSASKDGGRTWTEPGQAFDDQDGDGRLMYAPHPAILKDGSWIMMPSDYTNLAGGKVYFTRSTDEGRTWAWETTPMVAFVTGAPAVSPVPGDERILFSYNQPTDDTNIVWPVLAIRETLGGEWRILRLTDEPLQRGAGRANEVVVDGWGTSHVLYQFRRPGESTGEPRVASLLANGTLVTLPLARAGTGSIWGHYVGMAALEGGAVMSWPGGEAAPWDLRVSVVRFGEIH